jgi:hypothetical protein
MAEGVITLTKLTTSNSTKGLALTWTGMDTSTGAYVDLRTEKSGRVIIVLERSASAAWATASTTPLVGTTKALLCITKGSTASKFSAHLIGGYEMSGALATAANKVYHYFGPFESARFADSVERLHFTLATGTGSTSAAQIAAILI